MSEQARVAASRIVDEVFGSPSTSTGEPPSRGLPAAVVSDVADPPRGDSAAARRARALVAAVFDPPITPATGTHPAAVRSSEDVPPAAPTAVRTRARALVEEAAAAQEERLTQQATVGAATPDAAMPVEPRPAHPEPPPAPPEPQPAPPMVADAGREPDLFPLRQADAGGDDRLFAAVTGDRPAVPPEHRDLPASLEDDVEGPPPPPRQERAPAVAPVSVPPSPVPVTPAAAPPRADLAARLVSEVLEERAQAGAPDPGVAPAVGEGARTQRLDVEASPGVGRWLLVTAVGAVTLALLLPLAVAAIRELLALS